MVLPAAGGAPELVALAIDRVQVVLWLVIVIKYFIEGALQTDDHVVVVALLQALVTVVSQWGNLVVQWYELILDLDIKV